MEQDSSDGWVLRWDVVDSGVGLTAKEVGILFKPFSQADSSTTRKFGGTGLGLAISACLAKAMGGQIGVESEPGQGSRFWFSARLAKTSANVASPRVLGEPRRVLLAVQNEGVSRCVRALVPSFAGMLSVEEFNARGNWDPGAFDVAIVDPALTSEVITSVRQASRRCVTLCNHKSRSAADNATTLSMPIRRDDFLRAIVGASTVATVSRPNAKKVLALSNCEHLRVLVVEDNKTNQKVTLRSLKRLGIKAALAENGRLAVEAHEEKPFDLIFMDCQMPVMDGYDATRKIRSDNQGRPVSIVAMTANALSGDRELCLDAGMDDYMTKPVSLKMLRDAVVRWVPGLAES